MTIHDTNPGEIDSGTLTGILSKRDAIERASGIWDPNSAQRALDSALDSGDMVLVEALRNRAATFGWILTEGGSGIQATQARKLLTQLLNATLLAPDPIAKAEKFTDTRLNETGIAQERAGRIKSAVDSVSAEATSIVEKMTALAVNADAKAKSVLPVLNLNDSNQLVRTAQAWEYTIKPVLEREALTQWQPLLDALDIDGLFAVQRFVPGWVNTQPITAKLTSDLNEILAGAAARIPAASGSAAVSQAASNAEQAHDYLDWAQTIAASVAKVKTSADATGLKGIVQRASVFAGVQADVVWPGAAAY